MPVASNIEDAQKMMREIAEASGDDFRVKILRRSTAASPPETVAILDGATMEHLLNPEPWLSKLAGGSPWYTFQVTHSKDRSSGQTLAFFTIPAIPGNPASANPKIVGAAGWNGPSVLIYPDPNDAKPASSGSNGAAKWPPSTAQTESGVSRQPSPGGDGGGGPLQAMMTQLAQEREKLAEERHRLELEAQRREADAEKRRFAETLTEMRNEIRALRERPPEPKKEPTEILASIVAVATPLLTAVLPVIVSGREAAAKREEDRLARERQDRAETLKLFETMHEKAQGQSADIMKVVTPMVDAVSMMGRTVLQNVAMMREMNQEPPQDEGIIGLVKHAIGAWAEVQSRQPALPPATPPAQMTAGAPKPPPQTNGATPPQPEPTHEEVEVEPEKMVDMLAGEIRDRADVADLAEAIVDSLAQPDFVEVIAKEGGVLPAIDRRLGAEWGRDAMNQAYARELFGKVAEIAQAKGVDVRPLFPPG